MRKGLLQQVDHPQAVYDSPQNLFVAAFIGSPAMNLFEARLEQDDDALWIAVGGQRVRLGEEAEAAHPALKDRVGNTIAIGARPESIYDPSDRPEHPDDQILRATVELTEALGSDLVVHLSLPGRRVFTEDVREGVVVHEEEAVILGGEDTAPIVARLPPHSRVREGETVPLAIDTARLHFFDLETREAIWT
jgi:multiple sugar transport system ATP-binding protein